MSELWKGPFQPWFSGRLCNKVPNIPSSEHAQRRKTGRKWKSGEVWQPTTRENVGENHHVIHRISLSRAQQQQWSECGKKESRQWRQQRRMTHNHRLTTSHRRHQARVQYTKHVRKKLTSLNTTERYKKEDNTIVLDCLNSELWHIDKLIFTLFSTISNDPGGRTWFTWIYLFYCLLLTVTCPWEIFHVAVKYVHMMLSVWTYNLSVKHGKASQMDRTYEKICYWRAKKCEPVERLIFHCQIYWKSVQAQLVSNRARIAWAIVKNLPN